MKVLQKFSLFIFIFLLSVSSSHAMDLKIKLTRVKAPYVFHAQSATYIKDGNEDIFFIDDSPTLKISLRGKKIFLGKNSFFLPVTLYASENRFYINGKGYRGRLYINPVDGGYNFLNVLDIEDYLKGVVTKEMPANWPLEAIKAQSIIARTYAIYKATRSEDKGFDLYDSTLDQVYYGIEGESDTGLMAVRATKDMILLHNGKIIKSFYHSTSGGRTELPEMVWGEKYPYLTSITCNFDRASPAFYWEYKISKRNLENLLRKAGYPGRNLKRIKTLRYTPSGRNKMMRVMYQNRSYVDIPGTDFRQIVGNGKLKSTLFHVVSRADSIFFNGRGSGHGVGLCQWGARGMAEKGKTYQQIIKKYYKNIEINKISYVHGEAMSDFIEKEIDDNTFKQKKSKNDKGDILSSFIEKADEQDLNEESERGKIPLKDIVK
ncbi:MAG: SpoIID/LytB domain-containing protein [Nitrospinae bacterium]|nr:SpoIID/LytB domain-containing protein [Nitrospinota bacterium]